MTTDEMATDEPSKTDGGMVTIPRQPPAPPEIKPMTVQQVRQLVLDVAMRLVKTAAKAKAPSPDSWFGAFDQFAARAAEQAKPRIMASIADDKAGYDELVRRTKELVSYAEFFGMILDKAFRLVGPMILAM